MIDLKRLADLADKLDDALTDVGEDHDELREALGMEPQQPGEGRLATAFAILREISAMARSQ